PTPPPPHSQLFPNIACSGSGNGAVFVIVFRPQVGLVGVRGVLACHSAKLGQLGSGSRNHVGAGVGQKYNYEPPQQPGYNYLPPALPANLYEVPAVPSGLYETPIAPPPPPPPSGLYQLPQAEASDPKPVTR
ncbi:hypothetical protein Hamer_G016820, partial [Homarus americanus]